MSGQSERMLMKKRELAKCAHVLRDSFSNVVDIFVHNKSDLNTMANEAREHPNNENKLQLQNVQKCVCG